MGLILKRASFLEAKYFAIYISKTGYRKKVLKKLECQYGTES